MPEPPPSGYGTAELNTEPPLQLASFGPYSRNVTVGEPTGFTRPVTDAASVNEPEPITVFADATEEITDPALVIVTVSPGAAHGALAPLLFASPL